MQFRDIKILACDKIILEKVNKQQDLKISPLNNLFCDL